MTAGARALVRLVGRPADIRNGGSVCPGCRMGADVNSRSDVVNPQKKRFVDFTMTLPAVDPEFLFTGDVEPCTICERCLMDAVRVLGLVRDPAEHDDVIKLTAVRDGAFTRVNEALIEQQAVRLRQGEDA